MISMEEAYRTARLHKEGPINRCDETENYWIFLDSEGIPACGGCTQPVAVSKETGKPIFNYILCRIHHIIEDSGTIRSYEVNEDPLSFKLIK